METGRKSVATVDVGQRGVLMSTGTPLAATSMGHKTFMSVILREDTKPLMYHGHTGMCCNDLPDSPILTRSKSTLEILPRSNNVFLGEPNARYDFDF